MGRTYCVNYRALLFSALVRNIRRKIFVHENIVETYYGRIEKKY